MFRGERMATMGGRSARSWRMRLLGPATEWTSRTRSDRRPLLLLAILAVSLGIVGMHMLSAGHHAPAAGYSAAGSHESMPDPAQLTAPAGDVNAMAPTSLPVSAATLVVECGPECSGALGSMGAGCVLALALLIFVRRPSQVVERVGAPLLDRAMLRLVVHGVRTQAPRPPSLTALGISRT